MAKRNFRRDGVFFWNTWLVVLAAVWMIPLAYMISMSFRNPEQAFDPQLFVWPLTLDNYKLVLHQNPIMLYFFNSFVVTGVTLLIVTLGASMAAFGLTRPSVKGKTFIYSLLLSTLMVPISALVIPLAQINSFLGWQNTYWGLIFPYSALGLPFGLVVIKGFLDQLPKELEEAAIVDGCGSWKYFLLIVLPMLRPGLVVIIIWQFLTSWNEFFLALIVMTKQTMKTLPLVPMQYQGFYFSQPGALFAILVIMTLPTIVFYALVQRRFVSGLLSGAVKG